MNSIRSMAACVLTLCLMMPAAGQAEDSIVVDASAQGRPLPHFWEHMFGSGRAVLSLRDGYRQDMRAVRAVTAFSYVRFHAIFHDEVGLYGEDKSGKAVYNFSYIDQIYDGLLANGVRPFVELGFMPAKLASTDERQSFWYKPLSSPPKDYERWDAMMKAFAEHLIERYGLDEVSQWYFEVWNEPNLDFWSGKPAQSSYFTLYDHTARALKAVSPRLRVGGPATAQVAWVSDFIRHCTEAQVPVDFVSTHVYGDDTAQDVFGTKETIPRNRMVCRGVEKAHGEILASSQPALPLIFSEFNASWGNWPAVTDAPYMGPYMAETIRRCDGMVQDMSYWTFSDVFEEQGPVRKPFYGGFGLLAVGGIPKPAFNAFALLHQLGDERLPQEAEGALVTRRKDGALVLALWNYTESGAAGSPRKLTVSFTHLDARSVTVQSIDRDHGNVMPAYERIGSPRYPTQQQLGELRRAAALAPAARQVLVANTLSLDIAPDGLTIVTVFPKGAQGARPRK